MTTDGRQPRGAAALLRPRLPADLEPLADLWTESWAQAMPGVDFAARRGWFLEHLAALEAGGARTFCAVDDAGRLLGFVTANPSDGYLDQIAVAAAAKGSGVAGALIDAARALPRAPLTLDVNADNPRALRFYAREGFVVVGDGVNARSGLKTLRLRAARREPPAAEDA